MYKAARGIPVHNIPSFADQYMFFEWANSVLNFNSKRRNGTDGTLLTLPFLKLTSNGRFRSQTTEELRAHMIWEKYTHIIKDGMFTIRYTLKLYYGRQCQPARADVVYIM